VEELQALFFEHDLLALAERQARDDRSPLRPPPTTTKAMTMTANSATGTDGSYDLARPVRPSDSSQARPRLAAPEVRHVP
jgi:hypothetical protein